MSVPDVQTTLASKFAAKHVRDALKHFNDVIEKFNHEDWDGVALKAGKFVEAITKALALHCGRTLPAKARDFKAGNELRQLEQADKNLYSDVVRIVVPKACIFIYEIVNNRGGRHDAGEIDANHIDAAVVVPIVQWVLAELVRFSTVGGDIVSANDQIEQIIEKVHPLFENIEGRVYINAKDLGAPSVALLLAYEAYPQRIKRKDLEAAVVRHGHTPASAGMAVHRQLNLFDEDNGTLKLRDMGRRKAEELLHTLRN